MTYSEEVSGAGAGRKYTKFERWLQNIENKEKKFAVATKEMLDAIARVLLQVFRGACIRLMNWITASKSGGTDRLAYFFKLWQFYTGKLIGAGIFNSGRRFANRQWKKIRPHLPRPR